MLHDLRLALRLLLKSPFFTGIAVLALALGIGANTAIFTVVNAVFLRPLPFADPARLVRLSSTAENAGLTRAPFSHPRLEAVRARQEVFSDIAHGAFNGFNVTGRGDPQLITGFHATANYLPLLGVQPLLGRNFLPAEDQPGGPAVVMLSHRFWQRHFNGAADILSQSLTVNGVPHAVIGVLPAAIDAFPLDQLDLWVPRPLEVNYIVPAQRDHGAYMFETIARLKPGVTVEQAQANVTAIAEAYRAAHPKNIDAPSRAEVQLWLDDLVGEQRRPYLLLLAAVGVVLLIACANVANLLLARFALRRKEFALRFALGANRVHVIRQLLVESLAVALAGGALGLLFSRWSLDAILALGGGLIPRSAEVALDPLVLGFAVFASLLTGLAMGLLPSLSASHADVNEALKDSARGSSRGQGRLRSGLLVAEVALSLVLLISAGLLLASFAKLSRAPAGFQPAGLLIGGLNIPPARYAGTPKVATLYRNLYDRLRAVPGVTSAALADRVPLTGNQTPAPVAVSGRPIPPMSERATANRHLVTPDFFRTLGVQFKAGRDFNERDNPMSPHVVIINETFARRHFPNENPVGRTLITGMGQIPSEIVGIVADFRGRNPATPPEADYYLPALQRPELFTNLVIRTEGDPAAFLPTIRAALREVDPDLPILDPEPLTTRIAENSADRRLALAVLGGFAGLALVLAGIGVYSVMACIVGQRTTEIGIRMALGASPGEIHRMVLTQGLRLALLGVALGLALAFAVTRLLQQLLFEVQAHDPVIHLGLSLFLTLIAALACWLPARRATKVDPLIALRAE